MKQRRGKKNSRYKALFYVVNGVLLFTLLFALGKLIFMGAGYKQSARAYEALEQEAISTPAPTAEPEPANTEEPSPAPTAEKAPIDIDWATLQKKNSEIVAWLYCPDTAINYPVTQCNNNSYYLTHNANKNEDQSGALFLDCRNVLNASVTNYVLYGHRMNDGSMLGSLHRYSRKEYYEAHPVMYLMTPEQNYRVELFACRTVRSDDKYFLTAFKTRDDYGSYLDKALQQSYWIGDALPDESFSTLTLSTCSTYDHADDPRLLVHGVLVPIE